VQEDTVIARSENGEVAEILAGMEGNTFVETHKDGSREVVIRRESTEVWERDIPANARLRVDKNAEVTAGTQLTEGAKNPKEILRIVGREAVQLYLLEQLQQVYRSQGVSIHDKHIEVILRQLLRRVIIRATGDTTLLPGEMVDRFHFEDLNEQAAKEGGKAARAEPVVLGLTKAALSTESFLAAASFQETTRVLTEAATRGQRDELLGLKENVIIGKLIPVGTGFSTSRLQKFEKEQEQEIAENVDTEIEEIELELAELDLGDLDLSDLTGVAELGFEPAASTAVVTVDEESDEDLDLESLEEDEEETEDTADADDDLDSDLELEIDID
jgi:DNA-directed RNA polymerase subunit beta'